MFSLLLVCHLFYVLYRKIFFNVSCINGVFYPKIWCDPSGQVPALLGYPWYFSLLSSEILNWRCIFSTDQFAVRSCSSQLQKDRLFYLCHLPLDHLCIIWTLSFQRSHAKAVVYTAPSQGTSWCRHLPLELSVSVTVLLIHIAPCEKYSLEEAYSKGVRQAESRVAQRGWISSGYLTQQLLLIFWSSCQPRLHAAEQGCKNWG